MRRALNRVLRKAPKRAVKMALSRILRTVGDVKEI
jgi:hypothetical protein